MQTPDQSAPPRPADDARADVAAPADADQPDAALPAFTLLAADGEADAPVCGVDGVCA